ncbi:expressed unknown protein [Seminavis robusta]|uniref:Uncharacterized protein n=1 Tax=Seminavis robusta TaxID=568900 RepID=A0A9N8HEV3_9STRA|nr:expressed unknown protein [Seminavis robusta]|eukprot:Sro320_g116620.1 n/a (272) ;mRNA; f:73550-74365
MDRRVIEQILDYTEAKDKEGEKVQSEAASEDSSNTLSKPNEAVDVRAAAEKVQEENIVVKGQEDATAADNNQSPEVPVTLQSAEDALLQEVKLRNAASLFVPPLKPAALKKPQHKQQEEKSHPQPALTTQEHNALAASVQLEQRKLGTVITLPLSNPAALKLQQKQLEEYSHPQQTLTTQEHNALAASAQRQQFTIVSVSYKECRSILARLLQGELSRRLIAVFLCFYCSLSPTVAIMQHPAIKDTALKCEGKAKMRSTIFERCEHVNTFD